jgi:hypothetical protein
MKNSRFAGELLVAAELTRLGLSVALHNAMGFSTPAFDMMAANDKGESVTVQVKALKGPNAFLIDPERIKKKVAYVFVVVGEAGTLPTFHVVRGEELLVREKELFGKWGRDYLPVHGRGLGSKKLPIAWRGNWNNLGLGKLS